MMVQWREGGRRGGSRRKARSPVQTTKGREDYRGGRGTKVPHRQGDRGSIVFERDRDKARITVRRPSGLIFMRRLRWREG